MSERRLQDLFCERFRCSEQEYEGQAFRLCLYWHARVLARALLFVNPDLFEFDFKFIRYLGAATNWHEVKTDVNNFYILNEGKPSFWREAFRLRVSGRKATKLARELLTGTSEGGKEWSADSAYLGSVRQ
jgi:hypothetical protein